MRDETCTGVESKEREKRKRRNCTSTDTRQTLNVRQVLTIYCFSRSNMRCRLLERPDGLLESDMAATHKLRTKWLGWQTSRR